MFKNRCLACGHQEINYRFLLTLIYVAIAWIFAITLAYLILQNTI